MVKGDDRERAMAVLKARDADVPRCVGGMNALLDDLVALLDDVCREATSAGYGALDETKVQKNRAVIQLSNAEDVIKQQKARIAELEALAERRDARLALRVPRIEQ